MGSPLCHIARSGSDMPSLNERKRLRALLRRKERAKRGLLIAEGARVVGDLLDAGRPVLQGLFTDAALDDPAIDGIVQRLRAGGVPCEAVSAAELAEFADTVTPQGILVVAEIPGSGWEDLASLRVLAVDGVQDPGNLGTLIRTAEALGADGVLVLPGTTDPWSPRAVRAAAGASFRLPILELGHREAIDGLRERDVPLWVSAADGDPYRREDPVPPRVAIVVGNEGAGVSDEIRVAADRTVGIEQPGGGESLNVAAAAAILLDRILGGDRAGSR
jgi:TrmH family RNA methyltransferase